MDHRPYGELAATQHGVIAFTQARALGLTGDQIKDRVTSGRWERYEFHSTPKAVDHANARDRLLAAAQ